MPGGSRPLKNTETRGTTGTGEATGRTGRQAASRRQTADLGRIARIRQWWGRAVGSAGHERHTVLLIGKSTLAATVAWVISYNLLNAQSPAFAPFSAVLIMQVTVYQSVVQSLRYVGAVTAGVAIQAALGFLAGPDVLTFALVAAVALIIGRWPALGAQRSQVATAAFFAFSTYSAATSNTEKLTQLGQIILLVLIGCGVGVLVNLAVFPPMRYRSAEYGIRTLAHALCDLVSDVFPALRDGDLDRERTEQWRSRAARAEGLITQARSGLRTAQESQYYNPRRLLRRYRNPSSFEGYASVMEALERTLYQMASLTRSLDRWREDREGTQHAEGSGFRTCYARFLESISAIASVLAGLEEESLADQSSELCRLADEAQRCREQVAEEAERQGLPLTDPERPYGVLVVEATRLMEEFQHTCDVIQHQVDH
ncbi:aromatic acid exporter family protein [Streptomyces sp. NPDC053560]|uniref:aromatic acid exporter family protein n=1 Tax=Streptomyces sp. NPDC053560 TaxID=3365711 RepID=UPI0037CE65F6